jgi:hypothetical protein
MASEETQRQTCTVCGYEDKFDYHVPDVTWRQVVPGEYQSRVVCLSCFDDFAHDRGVSYGEVLRTLYFAGRAASLVFSRT